MKQTEIERVFLVKSLPSDLSRYQPIAMDVGDFYDPHKAGVSRVDHLGIRRKGKLSKKKTHTVKLCKGFG